MTSRGSANEIDNPAVKWSQKKIQRFQTDFLKWYDKEKRSLPWRLNTDPYRVWISEIMLQQTRVDTVIPYYQRFLEWFPTIEVLAEAPEDKLLKAWEGLGYYSRVRNIQEAARQIVDLHGGEMPNQVEEIAKLKGIGPYTTGAISSISFGFPEPAIDGNVMRVVSRLFCIGADIAKPSSRKIFDKTMRIIIDEKRPGDFNQALMDLGSAICKPKTPECSTCPIQAYCDSYLNQTVEYYPVKAKKMKAKPIYYLGLAIQNQEGAYLIQKREETGLLAKMWTFPLVEVTEEQYQQLKILQENQKKVSDNPEQIHLFSDAALKIAEEHAPYNLLSLETILEHSDNEQKNNYLFKDVDWQVEPLGEVTHIFSHLKWHILLFDGQLNSKEKLPDSTNFVFPKEFNSYTFPKPQQKMVAYIL